MLLLAGLTDSISPAGALVVANLNYVYDAAGANWDRLQAGAAGAMLVDGPIVDDAAFTAGTSRVFPTGWFADDTAPDSVDENDIGAPRMTLTRVANFVATDPTTITQRQAVVAAGATVNELTAQYATTLAALYAMGSADLERLVTAAAGVTDTVGTGIPPAALLGMFDDTAPASTTENQFGALRMSAARILYAGGSVAHDGVDDASNPLKIGSRAIRADAPPTAVAAADRVQSWMTLQGMQVVTAPAVSVDVNTGFSADVDAAVAATAGLRLMGYACRESAGTAAAATFIIVHGATGAGGTAVVPIELGPDESRSDWFGPNGIDVASGLSIDWIAGTIDCDLYWTIQL